MSYNFKHNWKGDFKHTDAVAKPPLHWRCADLQHDGLNFAKEIYIHKVIVTQKDKTVHALEYADFVEMSVSDLLESEGKIKPAYEPFFEYGNSRDGKKLNVSHTEKGNFVAVNRYNFNRYRVTGPVMILASKKLSATQPLYIVSTLSVGEYGNDPPHEFSGGLMAARCVPTIWFATADPSIQSIRFDYRFHLRTDDNIDMQSGAAGKYAITPQPTQENFASIIRDGDDLPMFSCLTDAMDIFVKIMEQQAHLDRYYDQYWETLASLNTNNWDTVVQKLINIFANMISTMSEIQSLMQDLIKEFKDNAWPCMMTTQDQAIEALKIAVTEEIENFAARIAAVIKDVLELLDKQLKIEELSVARGSLKVIDILDPWDLWDENIRKIIRQLEIEINKLNADKVKIKAKLKTDLPLLLDELIHIMGKVLSLVGFDSIEKPVQHEMVGNYLLEGKVEKTWDNLHWWGTNFPPSAPGAFHAIHQHFRWSRYLGSPSVAEKLGNILIFDALGGGKELDFSSETTAPFRSMVEAFKGTGIGGPLIDPTLPNQTIRFALAKNGGQLDTKLKAIQPRETFQDVAANVNKVEQIATAGPREVNDETFKGSDLVYWVSIQANREKYDAHFSGSLLINGFYFGHDQEPAASLFGSTPTNFAAITKGTSALRPAYTHPVKLFREPR